MAISFSGPACRFARGRWHLDPMDACDQIEDSRSFRLMGDGEDAILGPQVGEARKFGLVGDYANIR